MNKQMEWMKRICMHDYVQIGNELYFFAINFNGLYKISLTEKKLEFLGIVPDESNYKKHLYKSIVEANGKLYMAPMHGEEIAVYDLEKKKINKIKLKHKVDGMPYKFGGALVHDNKIYLVPARYPCLVIIDTITQEVMYLDDLIDELKLKEPDEVFALNGYFICDNQLYIAPVLKNILIKIELDNYEVEIIEIGYATEGFVSMCEDCDGTHIWFVQSYNPAIIRYNKKNGECKIYNDFPLGFECNGCPYINIICDEDKVYAIANQTNMTIMIDKTSGAMSEAKWDEQRKETEFNDWKVKHYFAKRLMDKKILLANADDNSFYIIDENEQSEEFYIIDEYSKERLLFGRNIRVYEEPEYGLTSYIKYILNGT